MRSSSTKPKTTAAPRKARGPVPAPDPISLVEASFHRIAPRAGELVARFYERLFEVAPSVRALFPKDLSEQRKKLAAALTLTIENLRRPEVLAPVLIKLGAKHLEYGAEDAHYGVVVQTLMATLAELDGEHFDAATEQAWAQPLAQVGELIRQGMNATKTEAQETDMSTHATNGSTYPNGTNGSNGSNGGYAQNGHALQRQPQQYDQFRGVVEASPNPMMVCDRNLRDLSRELGRVRPAPTASRKAPAGVPAVAGSALLERRRVIAVGASTGGPPVVLAFLRSLPADFAIPVLLVQHMPVGHLTHFVEYLARTSGRKVLLAEDGATLQPGTAYVAPGNRHLLLDQVGDLLVLRLSDTPEEHNCRPAVDPMFRSVARVCGRACLGVVMTGMGADGALGAVELRARGAPVVAQDRETSVVWGMPGAVVSAGAADDVVPGSQLADWVLARTASHSIWGNR